MKNLALTLALLIFFSHTKSQILKQSTDIFLLEGVLIQNLDASISCDNGKFATVVEFQIINFSDKSYSKKSIGVIIRCPELYGKDFFKEGNKYKLNVEVETEKKYDDSFDYAVQNMRSLEKYRNEKIFWANSIIGL